MQGGKAQANIGGKKRGTAQGKLEQEGQKGLEGACGVGGGLEEQRASGACHSGVNAKAITT